MTDPHLGVMLLAHRRPWFLPLIVEQALSEFKSVVDITVDAPSADVVEVVDKLSRNARVRVFESPVRCLAGKENFMQVRQFQLEKIQELKPRYGVIWDDDFIMEQPQEGRYQMAHNYDLIYATKRYVWDSLEYYNERMFTHRSVFFFKMLEGDVFPLDRMIHAPVMVHDSEDSRSIDLQSFLLDYGYLWESERERVFRTYAQAGKIDDSTKPLVMPPQLKKIKPKQCKKGFWQKLIEKELECLLPDKTP